MYVVSVSMCSVDQKVIFNKQDVHHKTRNQADFIRQVIYCHNGHEAAQREITSFLYFYELFNILSRDKHQMEINVLGLYLWLAQHKV